MKFNIKRFVLINIGLIILALGLYVFLIPSDLAVGGTSGLAMVINSILPYLPISLILGVINTILFIIAFIIFGKEFGGYTMYTSLALSGLLSLLEIIIPMEYPFTDDLFINLIFGILISGIGMGIIFNENASTGGTDIIARIINEYFHIDIGKSLLLSDFLITLFAGLVFGPRLGMYALLGVIINSLVIDKVIEGFNQKISIFIISDKFDLINNFILKELERGTTIYHATGGYSKEDKRIINTIVNRKEYIRVRDFVRSVDKKAFVSISHVTEVEGEGF